MPKKLSRLLIEGAPQNRENEFRELVAINIQNGFRDLRAVSAVTFSLRDGATRLRIRTGETHPPDQDRRGLMPTGGEVVAVLALPRLMCRTKPRGSEAMKGPSQRREGLCWAAFPKGDATGRAKDTPVHVRGNRAIVAQAKWPFLMMPRSRQ